MGYIYTAWMACNRVPVSGPSPALQTARPPCRRASPRAQPLRRPPERASRVCGPSCPCASSQPGVAQGTKRGAARAGSPPAAAATSVAIAASMSATPDIGVALHDREPLVVPPRRHRVRLRRLTTCRMRRRAEGRPRHPHLTFARLADLLHAHRVVSHAELELEARLRRVERQARSLVGPSLRDHHHADRVERPSTHASEEHEPSHRRLQAPLARVVGVDGVDDALEPRLLHCKPSVEYPSFRDSL